MTNKKNKTKFTILFNQTDPTHLRVAEILNSQKSRGKAQYIVDAIAHYERCDETLEKVRQNRFDEKIIEAVIHRLLRDKKIYISTEHDRLTPIHKIENTSQIVEEINCDYALDSIGEDGIKGIATALDMFRGR